ncbi:uncharacterized protein LY89DRAFT_734427 [Mollisia scopiformis]|uniref:DUF6594 domain-containing protein n=1 Tax=Mollisia scopiformis TaxID=149040 RepID=A0A194X830_MOLSC|nr:uncharacterized protein LY89DRAFT_734427 [Mollisia scopiformis]KUJ16321.1 hypothetical protein LY89DRAFT_734427 [Mollisia scopiformis]
MSSPDIELADRNVSPIRGFALVAAKINSDSDKTTTIYRRFDELSARNLLFYQAELAELEDDLKQLDDEDRVANDKTSEACQRDWRSFEIHANGVNGTEVRAREKEKMELVMKIREKLEKYHAALAAHRLLLQSPLASKSTLRALRNWFFNNSAGTKDGDRAAQLWGASSNIFSDPHDLVALRVPADQDRFSSFIHHNFGVFFQTASPDGRTTYTSEAAIARFIAILSTILAAVLLFGSIISLYVVKSDKALLGMLSAWTVLFAACVGLLTNARRDQVFAATAAYAAVLVVFISGNLGGTTPASITLGNCTCTGT